MQSRERLDLLAVVRGLEALDQPSRVTLVTASGYVHRGLRFGLPAWRQNGWQWERYGQMVPIKNRDLWQRVDRALEFHEVAFRCARIDPAHDDLTATRPTPQAVEPRRDAPEPCPGRSRKSGLPRRLARWFWSDRRPRLLAAAP